MRILVFVPCANLDARTVASLAAQDYDGAFDVLFSFDNPHGVWTAQAFRNVQLNYEKARQVVLSQGYDALLCVENDMILPPDALRKLVETDAPVVSGLYVLRHGAHVPNLFQWGASSDIGGAMHWDALRAHIDHGETMIPISGGCQGVVLLRRQVLTGFSFIREHNGAPDMDLMRYCWTRNIPQVARLDVQCGHVDGETVLHPKDYL